MAFKSRYLWIIHKAVQVQMEKSSATSVETLLKLPDLFA